MNLTDHATRLLLDDGPWTDPRLADLADEVGSMDEARRLVSYWRGVETALQRRMADLVPDRGALVLLGLERAGRAADFNASERARLSHARPSLERALEESPALERILASICEDATTFDEVWSETFSTRPSAPDRPAVRPVRPAMRRYVARFAMAASVVAFAMLAVFLVQRESGMTSVAAEDGIRMVNLADGSSVRLMSGAELTYHDGEFDRTVSLDGRGYFSVRPDEVPFRVLTPSATVTVLGTSFGVDSSPDQTDVVLVSGSVAVTASGDPNALVVLEPGQRTRVARGGEPAAPAHADARAEGEWTQLLFFRSTPLDEVAARLELAYGIRVEADPSLLSERVNGTFERYRPAPEVIDIIALAVGARVDDSTPGVVRLLPR